MATLLGSQIAFKSSKIWGLFLMSFPIPVGKPLSPYMAPCTLVIAKVFLLLV